MRAAGAAGVTRRGGGASVGWGGMPDLSFAAGSGELGAHLAPPLGPGPHPGVVVIQDLLGMSDDIREQADRLAAAGYLALAPNLYSGRGIRCVVATLRSSRSGVGEAHDDIEAARAFLAARPDCTGRIGIIGFCMGGGFALLCAPRGFAVASINYGEVPDDAGERVQGACPVVGSYGGRDLRLRGHAARLSRRSAPPTSRTTSRSIPTPATASSTASTPGRS